MHWTGKPHRLTSLVRIDEQVFRLMGKEPAQTPALPQTSLEVLPTRTLYTFEGNGVRIKLTFMTPALPSDLMACSLPTTYLTYECMATDGKTHNLEIYFDASGEIAVNEGKQTVQFWSHNSTNGGQLSLSIGSVQQPILARKGDDLRIDWGYLHVLAPNTQSVAGEIFQRITNATAMVNMDQSHVQKSITYEDRLTQSPSADSVVAAIRWKCGLVDATPVSRWLALVYNDMYAIRYMRGKLRAYWSKGWTIPEFTYPAPTRKHDPSGAETRYGCNSALMGHSLRQYEAFTRACTAFDNQLMADLRKVGGEKYARLCALAYRQTMAGNKICADTNGQPLMFPKENFSNGCIGTVDVLFPQAPFFLVFCPALMKAMLVPILDYAASPLWPYGYAPHDLGTYPHATGQVYGMKGSDGQRMPVEESGNMLIMLAALAKSEGNADLAKPYWPILTQWANYLVTDGLDPTNQLCSADMFGHLPRNANLALKAIIGIGGYAQLCELLGKPDDARKYLGVARDYAAKWQALAKDDGHTRLAYHQPGTWSMKHNLIWDHVLGLNLFPASVGDAEIAWYLKVQKPYGLPVDNRTDTSLIDWALWSIAPARNEADFQALFEPIYRYANETPSRVPLSDWFVTTNAKKKGFQARSVVGGIFIKMLADVEMWRKWSQQGANTRGPWAPIPIGGKTQEIVPTANSGSIKWRFTLERPADNWMKPDFDASAWQEGNAGFGTKGTPGAIIGTEWKTKQIWLRREFTLPERPLKHPRLFLIYDEDPEVYINGKLATKLTGWIANYDEADINMAALATLKPGTNVIAVHASQTYGGQAIDVGIVEDVP